MDWKWVNWVFLVHYMIIVGFCGNCNEQSSSLKCREILSGIYLLLKR
jgi:hypothetical protein